MAGIYIHIPFCKSRCIYCGFYSTTLLDLRKKYINAVCREMELRKNYIREPFSTIYLGGGTPSLLDEAELTQLFLYINNVYDVDRNAEITMECNPDDITPEFTNMLSRLPINRVSMGAQTFADSRLRLLHRRHNSDEVKHAVKLLREAGIKNISIDLMFGFPDESLSQWKEDISAALALNVEHISAYSLMYEEDTPLWKMLDTGKVKEIDEELSLTMFKELVCQLTDAGYEHYEISNFARPGYRSRHNSSYWHQVPYIGLGAAAHSFDLNSRQWNVADLKLYIEEINNGIIPMEREELDNDTTFNDIITTALRTSDGIDLNAMETRLGKRYRNTLISAAGKHIEQGLLEIRHDRLRLTAEGIFISDMVMSDLMIV
ncbi:MULTISPECIES: radical SAM family heme chaperone HemW [Prevotellaceae]|uniref:radical SAM family heme chaperone HemW n=1 Tax=Prevotellaceae TaxID=171552 RepID=UPI000335351A|nr:radical SAM family heme chaperone HemW [Prevotella sp. CAG:255]CCX70082.1 putative oxygen-independent coproporphyrinogen III oxidase [Prevotella sp. CAG:255]